MATPEQLIQLAASFGFRYPELRDDVANWLSWCLPRGVDPLRPAAPVLAYYTRETSHGPEPLYIWLHWSRPRRRPTAPAPGRQPTPGPHGEIGPPGPGRRGRRRRPATMLSADQTRRLLRAAEQHDGQPATVALFLLATTDHIRLHHICWLDVADIDTTQDTPLRLSLRPPGGHTLVLPPVVANHIAAHLTAYPRAREFKTEHNRIRVPLLRNKVGGRTTASGLGQGIRRIAATADPDIAALAARITPGWITVMDLSTW
ncbi:hypothetical protein [Phytohabitans rumicis]|uniref:Uncharacterized protein n=1 Tax=Phytohabitans rumicis TaxID=1076125 RepID=A0A6V8L7E7_9ACTN|nr:hypothetical protein [Phytohabitans rumicis]GFJ93182.1 hypothetical protein Prum_068240 [Phytohabitans rumicis]